VLEPGSPGRQNKAQKGLEMFANLKNKLIEEVKASPSKFQQFANAAQVFHRFAGGGGARCRWKMQIKQNIRTPIGILHVLVKLGRVRK